MKISFRIYYNYDDKCKIAFDSIFSLDNHDGDGNDDGVCDKQDGETIFGQNHLGKPSQVTNYVDREMVPTTGGGGQTISL